MLLEGGGAGGGRWASVSAHASKGERNFLIFPLSLKQSISEIIVIFELVNS